MFLAMILFFLVFFATLFGKRVSEPALEMPVSEAYHDEDVRGVQRLTPWLAGAVLLLILAYTMPFVTIFRDGYDGAPAYSPASPLPQAKQ
jgi:cytochrome c oxidase subunit 1